MKSRGLEVIMLTVLFGLEWRKPFFVLSRLYDFGRKKKAIVVPLTAQCFCRVQNHRVVLCCCESCRFKIMFL